MKSPRIFWHDLRLAPYDLPEENEEILTTVETISGERKTHMDIFLRYLDKNQYNYGWVIRLFDPESHQNTECIFWEEVIAWADKPDPYAIEREPI